MNKKIIAPFLALIIVIAAAIVAVILVNKKETVENTQNAAPTNNIENQTEEVKMDKIFLSVDGVKFEVALENNAAVSALVEKLDDGDIVIEAEEYGGFEKIGELEFSLPASDARMTTEPGDLVLYNGDQISLFYGENTWSYTKLGKINAAQDELVQVLGNGDVRIVLSQE